MTQAITKRYAPETDQTIVSRGDEIVGYVSGSGCENRKCRLATKAGRPFHATPRGFGVTLADYHFATEAEAVAALVAAR